MGQVVRLREDDDHAEWELAMEDPWDLVNRDELWDDSDKYKPNDPAMSVLNGVVLFFVVMGAIGALLKG